MSRKRKSDQDTSVTHSEGAEPPVATLAEPPLAEVVEQPSAEAGNGQSFAEKVGKKQWTPAPDPFGIATDFLAGVRLFESRQDRQMAIKFGEGRPEDKPSDQVIGMMKEGGFRWNPNHKIWVLPVKAESAMANRIDAEKLYQQVCQTIRQEKGIETTGKGVPF